jgi:hypothetical protein
MMLSAIIRQLFATALDEKPQCRRVSWHMGKRPHPAFNYGEFAIIKVNAGLNSCKISVKEWVEKTNAFGLRASVGRYVETIAHKSGKPQYRFHPTGSCAV